MMYADKTTARIVGVLFIIATAFLFIGQAIYDPVLSSPDYLANAAADRATVVVGILIEFTIVLAIPFIAVVLFPVLRRFGQALAVAYVGFRFLEAVLLIAVEVNLLSLTNLSRDFVSSGSSDASSYSIIGSSIQAANEWIFFFYVIVFAIGALVLYSVLYRSNLVPRFISAWGFLAAALMLIGTVLITAEVFASTPGLESEIIWALPIAVNEMVLAIWLILKGFRTPIATSEPDEVSTLVEV